jgi:glycine hydroxymethyltransferase
MKEAEMKQIAVWIGRALEGRNDEAALRRVRGEVREMADRFPLYEFLREPQPVA